MLELKAEKRQLTGRKVKKIRQQGQVPGVIYGYEIDSQPLKVDQADLDQVYRQAGENILVDLKLGSSTIKTLIHHIQFDPVTDKVIHVDFYHPSMDKKIESVVPLVFTGESTVVEDNDGTLIQDMDQVHVEALAADLPKEIEVDISPLEEFHDKILIEDLPAKEGVEIIEDKKQVVALVIPPEDVEQELEESVEEEVAEVKEAIEEQKEMAAEEEITEEEEGEEATAEEGKKEEAAVEKKRKE